MRIAIFASLAAALLAATPAGAGGRTLTATYRPEGAGPPHAYAETVQTRGGPRGVFFLGPDGRRHQSRDCSNDDFWCADFEFGVLAAPKPGRRQAYHGAQLGPGYTISVDKADPVPFIDGYRVTTVRLRDGAKLVALVKRSGIVAIWPIENAPARFGWLARSRYELVGRRGLFGPAPLFP